MAGREGQRVALVWDEALVAYDLGPSHPLAPVRVELTVELIRATGLLEQPHVDVVPPDDLEDGDLLRVHARDYLEVVRHCSTDPSAAIGRAFGLGPGDTPAFPDMHAASRRVAGATRAGARAVVEGRAVHAFNPAGGLHHAMPDRAAGFCVYNDPAVAIDWMLRQGVERIAYVDVDVHHGDGVERMFHDDPRVLTVSLHESGRYLFPGTGHVKDIGGSDALGSAVNVPLLPGTDGRLWLEVFDRVVPDLLAAFSPDVLVTQLGCDSHVEDPLAHLALRVDDQAAAVARLHELAHDLCDGLWLATGGGGYQLVRVVPRTWTRAFAEMTGARLPATTPEAWQQAATARGRGQAPTSFSDPEVEVDPDARARAEAAADDVVEAVLELVLPHHRV